MSSFLLLFDIHAHGRAMRAMVNMGRDKQTPSCEAHANPSHSIRD